MIDDSQLINILIDQSYIGQEDVTAAREKVGDDKLVSYLIENKFITRELVDQAVAEFYKIPYFNLSGNSEQIPQDLVARLPETVCQTYHIALIGENESMVTIAISDPSTRTEVSEALKPYVQKSITFVYSSHADIESLLVSLRKPLETRLSKIIQDKTHIAPELINEIIEEAIEYNSSDIHFEPRETEVLIRFRVDGILRDAGIVPKDVFEYIVNRIKVLARLRLDEHYAAQDGAIRMKAKEFNVDLRVSIIPIVDGEKIVIRVLSVYVNNFTLEDIGLSNTDQKIIRQSFTKRYGMILTTGPTGSGKTTTLYSIIRLLNTSEVNITTIEDPVEYKIKGVNQIQVNQQTGLTFARGLRSIVRQDPNIILVGEIRDNETAEIAVNAALTGHLLLSTFHANDASTAIPRLLDMGIEPFLLASTLNVIAAQRLARRICNSCRYSTEYTFEDLKTLLPNAGKYFSDSKDEKINLYRGKGCPKCSGTGYTGRIGLFEIIYVTVEMQDLILKNPSSQEIWQLAQSQGAKSFFDEGVEKVKEGVISLEELLRVAPVSKEHNDIYTEKESK